MKLELEGVRYEIALKAWKINLYRIDYGHQWGDYSANAETKNKAKSELFKHANIEGMTIDKEDVTYFNIPIIRDKENDLYHFEDEYKTKQQIEDIIRDRKRNSHLDSILSDESVIYCYIHKGSYYRPNWAGYTDKLTRAGIYDKEEAVSHARSVESIRIIPVITKEHNMNIRQEIEDLQSRLLLEKIAKK